MQPNIAAVIPTFNRGAVVSRAIDSVLRQTLLPSEIIVVDDGSTDNTLDIVNKIKSKTNLKIKIIPLSNSFGGPSKARNVGIDNSIGDYLFFLDHQKLRYRDLCV